jgi:hypothetical protein
MGQVRATVYFHGRAVVEASMIRLTELLLLLAPIADFIGWRVLAPGQVPSAGMIAGMAVLLAMLAGGLIWLRQQDAAPPDAVYIPRHIEGDRIVPDRSIP